MNAASAARGVPHGDLRVVRLLAADRAAIHGHLLRLSDDDRRMRFLHAATDRAIASYVTCIDLERGACFGAYDAARRLVCLAEGIAFEARGEARLEAAFSTDVGWRRLGLARRGFHALETWCDGADVARIVLHCDARNVAMRALLRSARAEMRIASTEIDALVSLPRTGAARP